MNGSLLHSSHYSSTLCICRINLLYSFFFWCDKIFVLFFGAVMELVWQPPLYIATAPLLHHCTALSTPVTQWSSREISQLSTLATYLCSFWMVKFFPIVATLIYLYLYYSWHFFWGGGSHCFVMNMWQHLNRSWLPLSLDGPIALLPPCTK